MDTNGTLLCQPSTGQEDDWKKLYESSFPQDERMAVEEIRQHLRQGSMLLHKTVNKTNDLLCFSLTFPVTNSDFMLLSYIATDPTKRSGGFGSKHMKRLVEILKAQFPNHLGLFLEIESTREQGLDPATHKARNRRLDFYQRLGAKRLCKNYLWPSMVPGGAPRHGEILWTEFGTKVIDDTVLARVILAIYEKAYNLKTTDPLVQTVLAQFSGATSGTPASTCPVPPDTTPSGNAPTGGGTTAATPDLSGTLASTKTAPASKPDSGTPVAKKADSPVAVDAPASKPDSGTPAAKKAHSPGSDNKQAGK